MKKEIAKIKFKMVCYSRISGVKNHPHSSTHTLLLPLLFHDTRGSVVKVRLNCHPHNT